MADTSTNSWKLLYETGRQALQNRKLQEAEQSFSAALQLAEDFAPGDPRLAATLNALARIYSLQRRYLAAAALLNRLLEVTERTLGPTHVQVAGVLTNLAEMYTHLGAAREELELRERVLSIRDGDPNADANSLQRLRDRVVELRLLLDAQESTNDLDDDIIEQPLPTVRTAEYSAPIVTSREPETEPEIELIEATQRAPREEQIVHTSGELPTPHLAAPASPAPLTTISAPSAADADRFSYDGEPRAAIPSPAVEIISIDEQPVLTPVGSVDYGFSDMGRDELPPRSTKKLGGRSGLYSIAAGVVLVAGLLAARDYVKGDDPSVSEGSVSLAASTPAAVIASPVAQTAPTLAPAVEPTTAADQRTVERMIADRRAEREARRVDDDPEAQARSAAATPVAGRAPRVPSSSELEKALKNVDVAVKALDQRTRAAADSALAIRGQDPTFKKGKMAEIQPRPE